MIILFNKEKLSKSGKKKETIKVQTTEKETVSKSVNKKKASPDVKKTPLTSKKVTPTKTSKPNDVTKSDIPSVVPQKRGRGRPRKYPKNPETLPTQSNKINPVEKIKSEPMQLEPVIDMEVLKMNSSEQQNVQNNNQTLQKIENPTEVNCNQDNADVTNSATKDVVCISNFQKQLKKKETSDIRNVVEGQFDDASSGGSNTNTLTDSINISSTKGTIETNTSERNEIRVEKKNESQMPDVVGNKRKEVVAPKPMFDSSGLLSPSPNQKSRSGRIVKRNTFHDEMDENDTDLRAATQKSIEQDKNFGSNLADSQSKNVSSLKEIIETPKSLKMMSSVESPNTLKLPIEITKEESTIPAVENSTDLVTPAKSPPVDSLIVGITKSDIDKSHSKQSEIVQGKTTDNKTEPSLDTNLARNINMVDASITSQSNNIVANESKDNNEKNNAGGSVPQSISSEVIKTSIPIEITKPLPISEIAAAPVARSKGRTNTPSTKSAEISPVAKVPRRKPGARECMQISRRFGVNVIPQKYMDILMVRKTTFSFVNKFRIS